jgi:hypothetical protein
LKMKMRMDESFMRRSPLPGAEKASAARARPQSNGILRPYRAKVDDQAIRA